MFGLRPIDGINILILLVMVWILVRIIQNDGNDIVVADFIATRGSDGKAHGDLNKLLQLWGGVVVGITLLMYAAYDKAEALGLTGLAGVFLGFCASTVMFAASLKSKKGSTTTVTEPALDPAQQKTTVTEMPPIDRRE